MSDSPVKDQVMDFCRAQSGVVGMWSECAGLKCSVTRLDSLAPTFIDANGKQVLPWHKDARPNPQVVLFYGPTWEDVLEQIQKASKS